MTRPQRVITGIVIGGTVVIAGIGFAGSYAAVRDLAAAKGFGGFAHVFPLGIDAGIVVLLALDLLLTWLRMPFPLLRHTAWLLTGATIAFNAAAAWPDPLGVAMHGVIPLLFVVTVEAARHAVGRLAAITADRHIEPVRLIRWILSPVPTFKLWRRMKLWELRAYDTVIALERDRLVYQARLRAKYGRGWRRKAPAEELMPLRLARYGIPLDRGDAAPEPGAVQALESHLGDALALVAPSPGRYVPAPVPVNGTGVKATAAAVPVNEGDRETPRGDGVVNPESVKQPLHAPAAGPQTAVKHRTTRSSQGSVNSPSAVNRLPSAPPARTVNHTPPKGMSSVNAQVTHSVKAFTRIVKGASFTREGVNVNPPGWGVNHRVAMTVNRPSGRETQTVNTRTVNPVRTVSVKDRGDREAPRVNDAPGVKARPGSSRRSRRAHATARGKPGSVHATVASPGPQRERARAAAQWRLAKKAEPGLTQSSFARSIGRSPAWLTKALKEAAGTADAAPSD
ncbi:DUF2637 domain-containing protein [Streptomyces sp. CAU 1734]|uniref:DUF2637 domain-containing protein n=1 Tax=Streptomyces sp. CAU 1734 TaxID=3140360 RepID=UPI0032609DE8